MRLHPTPDPQLVLLRHGETKWSLTGQHTGRTDLPLLPQGEERARQAGQALSEYHFGAVYTSPLQRASRTAELAGFPNAIKDDNLMEWDYGLIEGRTQSQISGLIGQDFQIFDDGIRTFDAVMAAHSHEPRAELHSSANDPGAQRPGEDLDQVAARATNFIARVEPMLNAGQDVLAVAHGHLLRILAMVWLGLEPRWAARFELGTAAICQLGFGHGKHTVEGWNISPVD